MPALSSILFAWASVHLFVTLYALVLFLRLRSGDEYAGFSLSSLAMAIYTMGAAFLVSAGDLAEAARSQELQFTGVILGLPAFILLLEGLAGISRSGVQKACWAWAGAGLIANLAGLFFDPSVPVSDGVAWRQPTAALLPVGIVYSFGSVGLSSWVFVKVARRSNLSRDLRLVFIMAVPSVAAWAHDTIVRAIGGGHPFLLEHLSLISSIGVSYVLLGRFVRLDDELRDRTRELRRSYEELQLVQEELVRKEQLAAVGELSAVIANEVRNPLEALQRAVGELEREGVDRTEQEHQLATLDEETDRLNRLVRDLLAYARPLEPQLESVTLGPFLEQSVVVPEDRRGAVELEWKLGSEGERTLHVDSDLLGKAISQIADNAIQAMPAGGVLTIRARAQTIEGTAALELSFHDTGEGMDQLVRERARDPFFTTRPSGTGLGLAIVERVVAAHGGRVDLQSSYGMGTTVTISLPTDRSASLVPAEPPGRVTPEEPDRIEDPGRTGP